MLSVRFGPIVSCFVSDCSTVHQESLTPNIFCVFHGSKGSVKFFISELQ